MVGKKRPKKVIMPSDLTGNVRAPRKSGPVISYILSDEAAVWPPGKRKGEPMEMVRAEQFASYDNTEQRSVLLDLVRQGKSDTEIGEQLGMSQWQIRNLRYKLGIKKDRGGNVQLDPISGKNEAPPDGTRGLLSLLPAKASEGITSGMAVKLAGEYSGQELATRLRALSSLVGAQQGGSYQLSLSLIEVATVEAATPEETIDESGSECAS